MGDFEEVKYHTRLKHEFISTYLNFYTRNVVESTKKKGGKLPFLSIFDLYAATGWVHCDEVGILGDNETWWEGSALLSAKCIGEYPNSQYLFLNTYNENNEKCKFQLASLRKSLSEYIVKYTGLSGKIIIKTLPIEMAVVEASRYLNRNYPNIWILDPYEPKQLPWKVIETIGNLKGHYRSKNGQIVERIPELIINFMSSYLHRFSDTQPEMATIAIGKPESEWRPKFEEYILEYQNAREAVLRLYFDRLAEIYRRDPVFILVKDTTQHAVIYCMLLCSNHPAGYYLMLKEGLSQLKEYEISEWKPKAEKIVYRTKHPGQQYFDDFV